MTAYGTTTSDNLAIILEKAAKAGGWSDQSAFITGETTFTYADLYAGMQETAAGLASLGVRPGDRVMTALSDGVGVVLALLGTWYLGAVAVMANPRLQDGELAFAASRCDPVLVVCDSGMAEVFADVQAVDTPRLQSACREAAPVNAQPVVASDPAYGLFTSGTTGQPRLCFHSHRDPLIHQHAFGRPVLDLGPGDVVLSVSKTYFAYGLGNSVFYPLLSGATAVLLPGAPSTGLVADHLSRRRVRALFAVPSFYAKMLADTAASSLTALDMAVCAGEVLPRSVEEGLAALGGPAVLNGIGTTEIGQTFASNAPGSARPGSVGRALPPYQVRIVGMDGGDAQPGIEGRLMVSGSTLALPCPDAYSFRSAPAGHWYETGDVGLLDGEGFLTVLGRHDDIEIVGGINVRPAEVEDLIRGNPAVADAAVCAVTDRRGVSQLVAYVVPSRLVADPGGLESGLIAAARGALAPYKVPKRVILVPELPRTPNGKLRRRVLRSRAAEYELSARWDTPEQDTDQ